MSDQSEAELLVQRAECAAIEMGRGCPPPNFKKVPIEMLSHLALCALCARLVLEVPPDARRKYRITREIPRFARAHSAHKDRRVRDLRDAALRKVAGHLED